MTTVSIWFLWLIGLGVLLNLLLSLWILGGLRTAYTPYRSMHDLENAYKNGQISREAYERFASSLR
jgi:hypothetical protein